jgi:hypothetical protein
MEGKKILQNISIGNETNDATQLPDNVDPVRVAAAHCDNVAVARLVRDGVVRGARARHAGRPEHPLKLVQAPIRGGRAARDGAVNNRELPPPRRCDNLGSDGVAPLGTRAAVRVLRHHPGDRRGRVIGVVRQRVFFFFFFFFFFSFPPLLDHVPLPPLLSRTPPLKNLVSTTRKNGLMSLGSDPRASVYASVHSGSI